jgi:hypothetical protein
MCVSDFNSIPFRPKIDQRQLVLGLGWGRDGWVVIGATPYPLVEDRVTEVGYRWVKAPAPLRLTEIRELAKKPGQDAPWSARTTS